MKPKMWLKENGFPDIKLGKGRMSGEQVEAVKAAVARGVHIEGYSAGPAPVNSTETPEVKRVAVDGSRVVDVPDESRRPEDWQAYTSNGEIGIKTVCNLCKSSLTYCRCGQPKVWLDSDLEGVVWFKPRTVPLPSRPW
jgi:hypothetical protein